mmetsp:Transcript_2220/g.3209  ORF Transcript_2220/g.3209 Transcript_2220/m.3209 type:complete len:91 (+) Transcript_2220:434-706(+)
MLWLRYELHRRFSDGLRRERGHEKQGLCNSTRKTGEVKRSYEWEYGLQQRRQSLVGWNKLLNLTTSSSSSDGEGPFNVTSISDDDAKSLQ